MHLWVRSVLFGLAVLGAPSRADSQVCVVHGTVDDPIPATIRWSEANLPGFTDAQHNEPYPLVDCDHWPDSPVCVVSYMVVHHWVVVRLAVERTGDCWTVHRR